MRGLVLCVHDETQDRWIDSPQAPCFNLSDGTPIFEVWLWHRELSRWFVMSNVADQALTNQGVIYFRPGDTEGLKQWIRTLGGKPRGEA